MMNTEQARELESIGVRLAEIAQDLPAWKERGKVKPLETEFYDVRDLLQAAWTVKQIARRGEANGREHHQHPEEVSFR